ARLRRQARTIVRTMSDEIASADRQGYVSITITIEHTGNELIPGFQKGKRADARPIGTAPISAGEIAKEHLTPDLEMILMGSVGREEIEFCRAETGGFDFLRFRRDPPPPPQSAVSGEDFDIPDRKKIYADIFKK